MFKEYSKTEKKFEISLVDEKFPDINTNKLIYDLNKSGNDFLVNFANFDFEEVVVSKDALLFVTEYTRFEILDLNDLKSAMSKKKVYKNYYVDDEALIISDMSDEETFMSLFGEELVSELFYKNFYYYVKGKTKKIKIGDFFKEKFDQ